MIKGIIADFDLGIDVRRHHVPQSSLGALDETIFFAGGKGSLGETDKYGKALRLCRQQIGGRDHSQLLGEVYDAAKPILASSYFSYSLVILGSPNAFSLRRKPATINLTDAQGTTFMEA